MGRLERYWEDVASLRAVGTSQDRWLTVTRAPDGEIIVDVRPGMLRSCTNDEIAQEVRTALIAALVNHREQYRQLRVEYFGSPLGVTPFTAPEPEQAPHRRYQA